MAARTSPPRITISDILPPYLTQNTDSWLTLLTITLHPDTKSVLNNLILTPYTNHDLKH